MSALFPSIESEINPIHLWSSLHTELVWIYEGAIHPVNRRRHTDHTHGYWVWQVRRGWAEVRQAGGRRLRARTGQCFVTPHGEMEQRFSDDAEILSVHFICDWPTGENLFAEKTGAVFRAADYPDFLHRANELARLVGELAPVAQDVSFAQQPVEYPDYLNLHIAFSEWLKVFVLTLRAQGFTYNQPRPVDERMLQAMQCLKEAPMTSPFPAELIQRESGLGRSRLDQLFLERFGMTTRSYWNQRRLRSARALLATTASPIKEVAFRLGFKQASHFTAWFQLQTGKSPLAHRQDERVAVR